MNKVERNENTKPRFNGAKKSLGQNFLTSKKVVGEIIEAGEITPNDIILEIGPGRGALTEKLLEVAGKVIAVEKDSRLIEELNKKFQNFITAGKLSIISGDILEIPLKNLSLLDGKYKVVANIPYYITGQLLRILLSGEIKPTLCVFMLQKEVAQRIVAKDNKESLLSLSVKVYGEPKYVTKVSKKYFSPQPKVDSAVLSIKNISREFFKDVSEKKFFEVIKAGFAHKRKQLMGNLKGKFKNAPLETIFSATGMDKKVRAEDLGLEHWRYLSQKL